MARRRRGHAWATSRRWTEQIAREVVAALEDSGESLAAFAKREGISAKRLYRWRARLSTQGALAFVELSPCKVAPVVGTGVFEIVIGSVRSVRVPPDFDASALRRLLDVLEAERC